MPEAFLKLPVMRARCASFVSITAVEFTCPVIVDSFLASEAYRSNRCPSHSISAIQDELMATSCSIQAFGRSLRRLRATRRWRSASEVRPLCASIAATESCRYAATCESAALAKLPTGFVYAALSLSKESKCNPSFSFGCRRRIRFLKRVGQLRRKG